MDTTPANPPLPRRIVVRIDLGALLPGPAVTPPDLVARVLTGLRSITPHGGENTAPGAGSGGRR